MSTSTLARSRHGDDREFLDRLRSGDDAAYAEWVRRESPRLLAVTLRILRDEDEAQDAMQEAFLSAWRALPDFAGDALLSTWLHRIGVNAALMRLRGRKRRHEQSIEELGPRFAEDGHHEAPIEPWTRAASCAAEQREIRDVVRSCIDRLPESQRTVLVLRDIEGLDTAEAARALDTTPEALKMRLHRARLALRSELAPYMEASEAPPRARREPAAEPIPNAAIEPARRPHKTSARRVPTAFAVAAARA